MFVQLSHGKDSLRRQGNSLRRNCEVQLWTLVNADKGFEVIPLYVAYQRKIAGYGNTSIVRDMPATELFSATDAGKWWESRYEVAPMTEILINYQHYDQSGGLVPNYDYVLLLVDPNAPLYRISVDLPPHHLSAVPSLHFEGRFHLVTDEADLPQKHTAAWAKHLSLDDTALPEVLDPFYEPEDRVFSYQQLEGGKTSKVVVTKPTSKLGAGRIRRVRNIQTR